MKDYFGTDNIHFRIVSDEFNTITIDQNGNPRPMMPRSFDSFSQAAEENGQSRIYLGIHWEFDKVQGIKSGDEIADYVFAHFMATRPNHSALGSNGGTSPGTVPTAASSLANQTPPAAILGSSLVGALTSSLSITPTSDTHATRPANVIVPTSTQSSTASVNSPETAKGYSTSIRSTMSNPAPAGHKSSFDDPANVFDLFAE
jgi:hypothetical protein